MNKFDTIYGVHAVSAKLNYNPQQIVELIIAKNNTNNQRLEKLMAKAKHHHIKISYDPNNSVFLSDVVHQGIIAKCKVVHAQDIKFLERLIANKNGHLLLLILDGITDPHNLGACLRSAAAANVDAVIAPKDNSVSLNETVKKVACGAVDLVPLISVTNLNQTIKKLKKQGIWMVATSGQAKQTIYQLDLNLSIAWVLGSEHKGVRQLTSQLCDFHASIPVAASISSLNVSVATGVCLFETIRQRQALICNLKKDN